MFGSLTERLSKALRQIAGTSRLSESNIQDTLLEIRKALLEADVALEVIDAFIEQVKVKALGQEVSKSLTPGQFFIKIVNDELTQVMGESNVELALKAQPPVVILVAGLQGSGKTTTAAKLAKHLQDMQKKKVMLVSCDVYRPAAIEQLKKLASDINADFYATEVGDKPVAIAKAALVAAKRSHQEVLIVDTAGRLHIDEQMMQEIKALHVAISPAETLFIVDGMTGQDAANIAKSFNDALPLTGIILTKIDGDARGGAALSTRYLTGKPIKFMGVGEKLDALEPFYPDRIASRISGMGDVLTLIEEIERKVDKKQAEKLAKKLVRGKGFNLEDFRSQLMQMVNMGGLTSMMDKLPGMAALPTKAKEKVNDKQVHHLIAIVNSMTRQERCHPALIRGSRKQRIAKGAGRTIPEVNRLLKQHQQMQKMMRKLTGKGGMSKMMRSLQGRLPPGVLPVN